MFAMRTIALALGLWAGAAAPAAPSARVGPQATAVTPAQGRREAAAVTPAQLGWMQATFLSVAPEPSRPVTLCDMDTGVDITPGNRRAVVRRASFDHGGIDDTTGHGTSMSLAMGDDGFNVIGMWPWVRIVSMRMTTAAQGRIAESSDFPAGIAACLAAGANVIDIELSDTTAAQIASEDPRQWAAAAERAEARGAVIFQAAGDARGLALPAADVPPGVVEVGAADAGGGWCAISTRGPAVSLLAPGCDLLVAGDRYGWIAGQGSSYSTAYAATATAALMAYSGLGARGAQALVLRSARTTSAGRMLDVAAAFRAAGLGRLAGISTPPAFAPQQMFVGVRARSRWLGRERLLVSAPVGADYRLCVRWRRRVERSRAAAVTLRGAVESFLSWRVPFSAPCLQPQPPPGTQFR
jgi:hypothetical protein